jgi:signal transduction histidine kinase
MTYKKIFKWEIFAGLTVILVINFILLNLLVDTVFKNALDRELDSRLSIIGDSLEKNVDESVFLLSHEDKYSSFYRKALDTIAEVKNTWSMDITFMNTRGKTCVSTVAGYDFLDSYILKGSENYSITYFDNGVPVKNYIYRYMKGDSLKGYIVMQLKGGALSFFTGIKKVQMSIMVWMFLFALAVSFIFSYLITRRIEYTVREMEIISKGDMDRQVKIGWFDEFSYLQDQVNKMVRSLKELQESRYREIQIVAMGLAHEIKNPAAAIYNLAEVMQKGKIDEKAGITITKIKNEVTRLNSITEKFIHFAREKEISKSSFDLGYFVNMLKEQYPALVLKYYGLTEKDSVQMDDVLLERAFKNIIKNAYEAGAAEVALEISKGQNKAVFRIVDNGKSIDPSVVDKIFVPFFTTKSTGMGIGLAITKNIIEKHGGTIEYKVADGRNCFEVSLPD